MKKTSIILEEYKEDFIMSTINFLLLIIYAIIVIVLDEVTIINKISLPLCISLWLISMLSCFNFKKRENNG